MTGVYLTGSLRPTPTSPHPPPLKADALPLKACCANKLYNRLESVRTKKFRPRNTSLSLDVYRVRYIVPIELVRTVTLLRNNYIRCFVIGILLGLLGLLPQSSTAVLPLSPHPGCCQGHRSACCCSHRQPSAPSCLFLGCGCAPHGKSPLLVHHNTFQYMGVMPRLSTLHTPTTARCLALHRSSAPPLTSAPNTQPSVRAPPFLG
jgi:hypothetical protein